MKIARQALAKPDPTDAEKQAAKAVMRARKIPAPRLKITRTETEAGTANVVSPDHPDPAYGNVLLANALATADGDFLAEIMTQLYKASSKGSEASEQRLNEQRLNFALAVIKGIKPQDQIETMLGAQMGAVHGLVMEFAGRLLRTEDLAWRDSASTILNKLARTFAMQVEALKRYRSTGEQKVIVQHVSVSDGGQAAIVGAVSSMGPGGKEKPDSTS
jgi:hypothetical protein